MKFSLGRTRYRYSILLLLASQQVLGAEPLEPKNAYSRKGEEVIKGAKIINENEFRKKLESKEVQLTYPSKIKAEVETARRQRETIQKTFESLKSEIPASGRLLPAGNDKEDGGTIDHKIRDNQGNEMTVKLLGRQTVKEDIVKSAELAKNRENHLKSYAIVYQKLPRKFLAEHAEKLKIKKPDDLKESSIQEILRSMEILTRNIKIIQGYVPIPLNLPPLGFPKSCGDEIGSGTGLDRAGGECSHASTGLYTLENYPLKWYATCVKNQGGRGSCVSFATTAAVESAVATNTNKWKNFSEQHLYGTAKRVWHPSNYGDGLSTSTNARDVDTKDYRFAYENKWEYNTSFSRQEIDALKMYQDSCDGYSGTHCTDTNHQGDIVCAEILGFNYCAYDLSISSTTTHEVTDSGNIWLSWSPSISLINAELMSLLSVPMTASLPVTPSFDNASFDGYISYNGSNESSRGGHAVEILAVIPNRDLPADHQGQGGGYFVVKNSWGACWKDAGYVYIPYAWAKSYLVSLNIFSNVR